MIYTPDPNQCLVDRMLGAEEYIAALESSPPVDQVERVEGVIGEFLRECKEAARNSDSDFNQGVVRGLEIAEAQLRHGHARADIAAALESSPPVDQVERVVQFLKTNGATHARWAKYFEDHPEVEREYVAQGVWDDAKEHRRLEAGYAEAVSLVRSFAALAPVDQGVVERLVEALERSFSALEGYVPKQEAINLIRPALRAAHASTSGEQWRPIETAPRDGTRVLLLEDGEHHYAGAWQSFDKCWSAFPGQPVVWTPEPTHWMSLPTPPVEGGGS